MPNTRAVSASVVGGLIGSIVMGLVSYAIPVAGAPFFITFTQKIGVPAAPISGWILHLVAGVILGAIFGVFTSSASPLRLDRTYRGAAIGVIAGALIYAIFFMPMLAGLVLLSSTVPAVVGGLFLLHLLFGLIMGIVGTVLWRQQETSKVRKAPAESISAPGRS